MPEYGYRCALCKGVVELDRHDADGEPCVLPCEGVIRRIWSFYLKPVQGGGGSKGHYTGGE